MSSKIESMIAAVTQLIAETVFKKAIAPAAEKTAEKVTQTILDHPSLIVAGAAVVIGAKELAPHVKKVVDPVLEITNNHPKTTLLTTASLCSAALPWAATGEPIGVTTAAIACSSSALSLIAYLNKDTGTEEI